MKKYLLLLITASLLHPVYGQTTDDFRQWGEEALKLIDTYFVATKGTYLYSEKTTSTYPATAWPLGIQIKALIHAGRIEDAINTMDDFHKNYYMNYRDYWAYAASYQQKNANRYYDDNAWIVMDLMQLYDITKRGDFLSRAKIVLKFCMSGETPTGGIMFNERENDPSAGDDYLRWRTCATAPTAYSCLLMYQVEKKAKYLEDGRRLYDFMREPGNWGIGPGYRGYENAVIMRVALLLHQITGEQKYLDDAYQLAYSMETQYIDWKTGRLQETGQWGGHDMTDAYVDLYNFDKNPRWLHVAGNYLAYIRENGRNDQGFYAEEWTGIPDSKPEVDSYGDLKYQASPASAFMLLASSPVDMTTYVKEPVALFKEKNYNDGKERNCWSMGLQIGDYTQDDLQYLGMTDSKFNFKADISSIQIADGYKVTLYENGDLTGASKIMYRSTETLGSWNDRAKSIRIEALDHIVSFYKGSDFNEEIGSLPLGRYSIVDLKRLGITDISSLKVKEGYEVVVFAEGYFYGGGALYSTDMSQLDFMDNNIQSVIISPAGTNTSPLPPSGMPLVSKSEHNIRLYPTIVKDILHIDNLKQDSTLEILSLNGNILTQEVTSQSHHTMNVAGLPHGAYLLQVRNDGGAQILKFIKA